jgi:hypothetical protein
MKTFFASILILAFSALASAQTFKAFSVTNVVKVGDNTYTAEKYIVDTHGEANAGDVAQKYITFKTEGCKHVPSANASAIWLNQSWDGSGKLIFSDGPSCKVDVMESTATAPATPKK